MPTGYTAPVADGTMTSFRDFALRCARAFGAAIMQRDDSMDAPLQLERKPSDFHKIKHDEAVAELERLERLSYSEWATECAAANQADLESKRDTLAKWREENARLDSMMDAVRLWAPPTPDHEEMRKFMLQQLEASKLNVESDWMRHVPKDVTEYKEWKLADVRRSIERNSEEHQKELDRCANATKWLTALVESLPAPSATRAVGRAA